jgi:hypothetical protein
LAFKEGSTLTELDDLSSTGTSLSLTLEAQPARSTMTVMTIALNSLILMFILSVDRLDERLNAKKGTIQSNKPESQVIVFIF